MKDNSFVNYKKIDISRFNQVYEIYRKGNIIVCTDESSYTLAYYGFTTFILIEGAVKTGWFSSEKEYGKILELYTHPDPMFCKVTHLEPAYMDTVEEIFQELKAIYIESLKNLNNSLENELEFNKLVHPNFA